MENNDLLKRTSIRNLSTKTGISTSDLKKILSGTYTEKQISFNEDYVPQKRTPASVFSKESLVEKINRNDEASELWNILSGISYDQPEYVVCYEKLLKQLKEEADQADDTEELDTIIVYTPSGSVEEKDLMERICSLEKKEIAEEDDFDELITMYKQRNLYPSSDDLLVGKILDLAKTPEQSFQLLEEVFPNSSMEYYRAIVWHNNVLSIAISEMKSVDDSDEIAPYIYKGKEEEIILAKRIVEIGKDSEDILSREDDFSGGSEAQEVLIVGAIRKCTDYKNDEETLSNLMDSWDSGTYVHRIAFAKNRELLVAYLAKISDTEEMKELIDNFSDGDNERMKLEKRIIELTNDLDELQEFSGDSNKHLSFLSKSKLSRLLIEKINIITLQNHDDYDSYVEDESIEKDAFNLKRTELCITKDDADDMVDSLEDNSYSVYLLAKKFGSKISNPVIPAIMEAPVQNDEKVQEEKNLKLKNQIRNTHIMEDAISIFDSLPAGDPNIEYAYKRAEELLVSRVEYPKSKEELINFLDMFPSGSNSWVMIVKKIAEYYPKPWYLRLFQF